MVKVFGVFFPLKAKRVSVGVHSALCTCHTTWNMALGWEWEAWPHSHTSPLPCLLNLRINLVLPKAEKPSRAKNFPCYCACKTPGITGPLSEHHRNKNHPWLSQTVKPWMLWKDSPWLRREGGDRNGMGALSRQGSPAWAYVMENGTGPCRAELECGNCNGLWRSAARLNRVETLQIHKTCESESLQLSFLTARGEKKINTGAFR